MNNLKYLFMVLILLLLNNLFAQESNLNSNKNIVIQIEPTFQNWDVNAQKSISEFSNAVKFNYYVNRALSFSFTSGYAFTGGDYEKINGLSDSQLAIKYIFRRRNIIFDAGVNIPNGKENLTANEFQTSSILGQDLFGLRIPSLGQGFNLYFGGVWAIPVSDITVLGIGASYQIKGSFEPVDFVTTEYTPSNELLLTGGIDMRLNRVSNLSADLSLVFYGDDKFDGKEIYSSGNRILLNLMFRRYISFHVLRIFVRYRNQTKGEFLGGVIPASDEKYNPNLFSVKSKFSQRINQKFRMGYEAEVRFYEKTVLYHSGYNILGIGVSPELKMSQGVNIIFKLKYYTGNASGKDSISGFESGIHLSYSL